MAITEEDINLQKFLEKFTFQNEVGKINIAVDVFLQTACLLRIDKDIRRLINK